MNLWDGIATEARADATGYLIAVFFLAFVLTRAGPSKVPSRPHALLFFFGLHLLLLPVAGALRALSSPVHDEVRLAALIFAAVATVGIVGRALGSALLPRLRLSVPRILQDVLIAAASVIAVFGVASHAGFNLSGLIATSAVVTAVIGFSLQDSLANVMGGLALQIDNSLEVGDWIRVGEHSGKVREIRWRHVAIETNDWETVILPNSLLMKQQVVVLGRRAGEPKQLRRWVRFNVDFRHQPSDVIEAVSQALLRAKLPNVAVEPPPNCVLTDFHDSYGRYALRYWLTDLNIDEPTDSQVRTVVYFALKRAGIPLSIPAHALFLTEESGDRRARKVSEDQQRRVEALGRVELFSTLTEAERGQLAAGLRYAPFTSGEVITRQGTEAHWLYLVLEGNVSVRVSSEGGLEREVARLSGGSFFGEMSLLTGEPRSATVVALSDVECYRLDKHSFEELLAQRPELAEDAAAVLASRRLGLVAAKEGLDQATSARQLAADKHRFLGSIRAFFRLGDPGKSAAS